MRAFNHSSATTNRLVSVEPAALKPGLTLPQLLEAIGTHALGASTLVGWFAQRAQ
jgi:hypothetical protein